MKKLSEFLSYVAINNLPTDKAETWELTGLIERASDEEKKEIVEALHITATIIVKNFETVNSYFDELGTISFPFISRIVRSKRETGGDNIHIYKEFKFDAEKVESLLRSLNDCYGRSIKLFEKDYDNSAIDIQAELLVFIQRLYTASENNKFKNLNKNI